MGSNLDLAQRVALLSIVLLLLLSEVSSTRSRSDDNSTSAVNFTRHSRVTYTASSSEFRIDEYTAVFGEPLAKLSGRACSTLSGLTNLTCQLGCNYASLASCGQLDPRFPGYDECVAANFSCEDDFASRPCASLGWIELEPGVPASTARIAAGYGQTYRVFVPDIVNSVASLTINIIGGEMRIGATLEPDNAANVLLQTYEWTTLSTRGATYTLCPWDLPDEAGTSGTLFLRVDALDDAVYSVTALIDAATEVTSVTSVTSAGLVDVSNGELVYCQDGCPDTVFRLQLPDSEFTGSSAGQCVPVSVARSLLSSAALLLTKDEALASSGDFDMVVLQGQAALMVCQGESVFVKYSKTAGLSNDEQYLYFTTEGYFTYAQLDKLNFYEAAALLLNTLVAICPNSTSSSSSPTVYRCYNYDESSCPFFISVAPQNQTAIWPPLPSYSSSADVGLWDLQAAELLSDLFDYRVNARGNAYQFFVWRSLTQRLDTTSIAPSAVLDDSCSWRLLGNVVGLNSMTVPTLPSTAESVTSKCSRYELLEQLSPLKATLLQIVEDLDSSQIDKLLNFGVSVAFASDVFEACSTLVQSLYEDDVASWQNATSVYCFPESRTNQTAQEFKADPCCSNNASLYECCAERTLSVYLPDFVINQTDVDLSCHFKEVCSDTLLNGYADVLRQQLTTDDCTASVTENEAITTQSWTALKRCSTIAFSANEYTGWTCLSDDDCPDDYTCDLYINRCNISQQEMERRYVECLVGPSSNLTVFVLSELASSFNITAQLYSDAFVNAIVEQFQANACVLRSHPDLAIDVRSHWTLEQLDPLCTDSCSDQTIKCLESTCAVSELCLPPFAKCERAWFYLDVDENSCNALKFCNLVDDALCLSVGQAACSSMCKDWQNTCGLCFDDEHNFCTGFDYLDVNSCSDYRFCSLPLSYDIVSGNETCESACTMPCASTTQSCVSATGDAPLCVVPLHTLASGASGTLVTRFNLYRLQCELLRNNQWQSVTMNDEVYYYCLNSAPTASACEGAGYTWVACEGLTEAECTCLPSSNSSATTCNPPAPLLQALHCSMMSASDCDGQDTCETSSLCSDRNYFVNQAAQPPVQGACVRPFQWSSELRCLGTQIPTLMGCVDWTVTEADCPTDQWHVPVPYGDSEACLAYGVACDNGSYMTSEECSVCSGETQSIFDLQQGRWVAPQVAQLSVVEPRFYQKYTWQLALDVDELANQLSLAIDLESSFAQRSAALCSLMPSLSYLPTLTCGCAYDAPIDANVECFTGAYTQLEYSGVGLPCLGQSYLMVVPPATLNFTETSVSSGCRSVLGQPISSSTFVHPSVDTPHSLFIRLRTREDYTLYNAGHAAIGRIAGAGVQLLSLHNALQHVGSVPDNVRLPIPASEQPDFVANYTPSYAQRSVAAAPDPLLAVNVTVCLPLQDDYTSYLSHTDDYPFYDFAVKLPGQIKQPMMLANMTISHTSSTVMLCGLVPELYYDMRLFPIIRVENPDDRTSPLFAQWELGIIFTTSALYFLVLLAFFWRIGVIVYIGEVFSNQIVFPVCLAIFDSFRAVYFVLLGTGHLNITPEVAFLIVDIPYFFYFLGMTLLLWWWISLAWTSDRTKIVRNFRLLTFGSSAIFISLLVVVGVLYFVLNQDVQEQCGGLTAAEMPALSNQEILLIVYKSVLGLLTLLGCLGFLWSGWKLRSLGLQRVERTVTLITLIAFASFLGQTIYFILLAVTSFATFVYSLIPLWFIEVLPQVLMLYFQQPSKRSGTSTRSTRSRGSGVPGSSPRSGGHSRTSSSSSSFASDRVVIDSPSSEDNELQIYRGGEDE